MPELQEQIPAVHGWTECRSADVPDIRGHYPHPCGSELQEQILAVHGWTECRSADVPDIREYFPHPCGLARRCSRQPRALPTSLWVGIAGQIPAVHGWMEYRSADVADIRGHFPLRCHRFRHDPAPGSRSDAHIGAGVVAPFSDKMEESTC